MKVSANVLVALVALEHVWFLVLEMFLWQRPIGLKTFKTTKDFAAASAGLAANQGLYNGFLAAGLVWALLATDPAQAFALKVFFLACVAVAGVYGALSVSRSILYVQALPAFLSLALLAASARGWI